MDSSRTETDKSWQKALIKKGQLLGQHKQVLYSLVDTNQFLLHQVAQLTSQISSLTSRLTSGSYSPPVDQSSPPMSSLPPKVSYLPDPELFFSDHEKCRGFLLQCTMVFQQRLVKFPSDQSKIFYIMGLMRGKTFPWQKLLTPILQLRLSVSEFIAEIKCVLI